MSIFHLLPSRWNKRLNNHHHLSSDEAALRAALAEELRPPHFIHLLIGMLHHLELVKTIWQSSTHLRMLLVKGSHLSTLAASILPRLHSARFLGEKLIQGCLLAPGARALTTAKNFCRFPR
ncbi:MAG: hypothetical protein ACK5TN_07425 [Acidobacteriota bacterium]